MKVVQSASLCDAKKVNQQVAKLEAKQKAMAETAKPTVEEAQKKIEDIAKVQE